MMAIPFERAQSSHGISWDGLDTDNQVINFTMQGNSSYNDNDIYSPVGANPPAPMVCQCSVVILCFYWDIKTGSGQFNIFTSHKNCAEFMVQFQ
jgi:hypothetical protein